MLGDLQIAVSGFLDDIVNIAESFASYLCAECRDAVIIPRHTSKNNSFSLFIDIAS